MPAATPRGFVAVGSLGPAGLVFCSGGNLRTGSAIALLLAARRLRFGGLNRVAHVVLDHFQLSEHAMCIGWADALERCRGEFGAQPGQLAEQGPRRLAQVKPVDAAVGLVTAPLDPAIVAELVDQ